MYTKPYAYWSSTGSWVTKSSEAEKFIFERLEVTHRARVHRSGARLPSTSTRRDIVACATRHHLMPAASVLRRVKPALYDDSDEEGFPEVDEHGEDRDGDSDEEMRDYHDEVQ